MVKIGVFHTCGLVREHVKVVVVAAYLFLLLIFTITPPEEGVMRPGPEFPIIIPSWQDPLRNTPQKGGSP